MKIDAFCHVMPQAYYDALKVHGFMNNNNLMLDMDARRAEMATHGALTQIVTSGIEELYEELEPKQAIELARHSNDAMAQLLEENPDLFAAGIANVYLGDVDEAIKEVERCVTKYGFRGALVPTTYCGKPLASKEFFPFYEKMAELDLPIEVHPCHGPVMKPDMIFNWPIETSWMMINLSTSGVFERWPEIKFVTHHCGAMIPVWNNRIYLAWYLNQMYKDSPLGCSMEKSPEEYFDNLKKFYNDTALYGDCTDGIMAGVNFFGADHVLFGTDYPLNGDRDPNALGETANIIRSIERLNISEEDRQLIFEGNARRIFKL